MGCHCNNLIEAEDIEAVLQDPACSLRGVALVPVTLVKPPADLDDRDAEQLQGREANEADEGSTAAKLDRPESPAMILEMPLDLVHERAGLDGALRRREVLHHSRVRVHGREGLPIRLAPAAKDEALSLHDARVPDPAHARAAVVAQGRRALVGRPRQMTFVGLSA